MAIFVFFFPEHFRVIPSLRCSNKNLPCLFSALPIVLSACFCVRSSADLPGCLADVTRCLQLAAAAGGPSAQTESAGGIKGPSPKKATGVGLRLVCSPRCFVTSDLCVTAFSRCLLCCERVYNVWLFLLMSSTCSWYLRYNVVCLQTCKIWSCHPLNNTLLRVEWHWPVISVLVAVSHDALVLCAHCLFVYV